MRLSDHRLPGVRLTVIGLVCFASCLPAAAQQLISAKSGLIHYTEGDVRIGDQAASPNNGIFQSLANARDLTTGEGRAEMLLGPGQFVRLNENSSLRMVSNRLEATRVDLLTGSILVELIDGDKNSPITIGFGSNTIELRKAGLYRIDANESRLRVLDGEAVVRGNGQNLTARKSKEVSMGAVLAENGFDGAVGDEFTRWAQRRAGYVATANISGARDIFANGQNWSGNNWAFNPWYGMYTYVPSRRMSMSPFGFNYFTPDMAFNGMFWDFLGGGYGFYGNGFGYGYGSSYYNGYGYGNGYGSGNYGGGSYGGGGVRGTSPNRPGTPVNRRPDSFGPRGTAVTSAYGNYGNSGSHGGGSMVRGGGGSSSHSGDSGSGGGYRGGGGYSTVSGGGSHSGGGYSGGGGHSSGTVSGGGSSAPAGSGASAGGSSAGGRAK